MVSVLVEIMKPSPSHTELTHFKILQAQQNGARRDAMYKFFEVGFEIYKIKKYRKYLGKEVLEKSKQFLPGLKSPVSILVSAQLQAHVWRNNE